MPTSLPALAAALAAPQAVWSCLSDARALLSQPLAPAYRVPPHRRSDERRRRLADAVGLLAERLDRCAGAYGHWSVFDAGAFFDLRPRQVQALLRLETLGATLDLTLHADLLSPAFREAERFWAEQFCPAWHAGQRHGDDAFGRHFRQQTLPAMQRRLEAAREELSAAGRLLFERGDVTFLLSAAAPDERQRHLLTLPPGDEDLALLFLDLPTLTLSRSFDLLEEGRQVDR